MLSMEHNDILTRVGPGTPLGELMREYWVPACLRYFCTLTKLRWPESNQHDVSAT